MIINLPICLVNSETHKNRTMEAILLNIATGKIIICQVTEFNKYYSRPTIC